ncbi:MAG: signal recognition particle-docking protein FtsY [Proteobacteria bacterium]|nr:MAG: signal recognition particle-docking protein FtsY [Pseudomonadota bacterium]PIE17555.1 MAG: signal recognition particle-docking protein FtsY [Pseudomonadota bacterium]
MRADKGDGKDDSSSKRTPRPASKRSGGRKLHPVQQAKLEAEAAAAKAGAEDDGDGEAPATAPKRKVRAVKGGRRKALRGQKARRARRAAAQDQPKDETDDAAKPKESVAERDEPGESEKERLTRGLAKTRGGFIARLGKLFSGKPTFDETMLDEVEEVLFTADIGARTADELIQSIRKQLGNKAGNDPEAVWQHLKGRSAEMLRASNDAGFDFGFDRGAPFVLLMVGVNGTGKTTTIGKLAQRFKSRGKKVMLAAGDTYRAAAAEQLCVWGERAGVEVVRRDEGADPASVVVEAIKKAKVEGYDVVIADTAGRLQTNVGLMEELTKVHRSMNKHVEGAPHETFLVLDATTGQNAITQAKMFREAIEITGLVLTKLDGTAKGGVILGIAHELGLPVRFVGIGEQADDLRPFDPDAFVEALYHQEETPVAEQSS